MVDIIDFFRFFDFSTYGGGSRWSILLKFSVFQLFDLGGGGSKWSILLNNFRPMREGLNSRFYCFFFTFPLCDLGRRV